MGDVEFNILNMPPHASQTNTWMDYIGYGARVAIGTDHGLLCKSYNIQPKTN